MRLSRGISMLGMLASIITSTAFGQEIQATKTASRGFDSHPYAIMAMRHHNIKNADGTVANLQFRPTIGFKLIDGLIDASILARYNKYNGESEVKQGAYTGTLLVKTIELGPLSIDPYVEQTIVKDQPSNNKFAAYNSLNKPVSTRAGIVTFGMGLEVGAYANNTAKDEQAPAEADRKVPSEDFSLVGLDESGAGTRKKTTNDFYHEWDVSVGIKPQIIPGLGLTFRSLYNATYEEKFVVEGDNSRPTYPLRATTSQRFYVTYKVSQYLNFVNETWIDQDGAWARRTANQQVVNLAKLEYTLYK